MAGISRWNHGRIIRHSAIKNSDSQPNTGSQRGQDRSIFVRVKLLENVAMVWA
jgi:hypothetical protein